MHAATDIGSVDDWLQSQVELNSDENGCLADLHIFETRWSPPSATLSGSPNQTVRYSPRALHPVQA